MSNIFGMICIIQEYRTASVRQKGPQLFASRKFFMLLLTSADDNKA